MARANLALAPGGGRLAWESLRVSWFGPAHLTGVVLRDAQGDPVVAAPRATLDRTLGRLLFDRPRFGTLVLDRAAVEIDRRPDGTVDLYETIKPVLKVDPRTQLRIVVPHGRLTFRATVLTEPVAAEEADIVLDLGPAPAPIAWNVDLKRQGRRPGPAAGSAPATLVISGHYDRWWDPQGPPKDLDVRFDGTRWPWAVAGLGLAAHFDLGGRLDLSRRSGRWALSGDAVLSGVDATGARLAGDHLRLERFRGSWEIGQTAGDGAWAVRRLDVDSPIVTLRTAGPLPAPAGSATRIEGTLDLAALAHQIPHALRLREGITLRRGVARVQATTRTAAETQAATWEVDASVSDLEAGDERRGRSFTLQSPANLSARLQSGPASLALERLALKTAFLEVIGVGDVDTETAWTARFDLDGLQRQLRDLVDFGALELAGRGDLVGEYRRKDAGYAGHATVVMHDLRARGLGLGSAILERDHVRLEANLDGPASDLGLPRGWDHATLGLTSGPIVAAVKATAHAGTLTLAGPVALNRHQGRLEGQLSARWDDAGATIEQARLMLTPELGEGGEGSKALGTTLAARGRFDRARGELVLTPPAAPASAPATRDALALGADGLRIAGIGKPGGVRADLSLVGDTAALGRIVASWGGPAPGSLAGRFTAHGRVQESEKDWLVGARLDFPDLILAPADTSAGRRSAGPVGLALNASYQPGNDRLDLTELVLASRYATLQASGRVSDLDDGDGMRRADLLGTLTLDWDAINRELAARVEPRARVAGRSRPFHLSGPLHVGSTDDLLRALDLELGVDLETADVFGMSLGPAPLVVRARSGRLLLDPIDTTLNQGRIHLQPEVVLDDPAGPAIRLGPDSWVADAVINDDVSHRVLAFAAPVLDNATRARGRVSVRLKEALFPLGGGPEQSRRLTVTGSVLFQDAEFVAGPIADRLFELIGPLGAERPVLKLNQPISLTIADRRVYQRGLAIPIGRLNTITIEGSVDFDRNLALKASLPILPTMWSDRDIPVLTDLFGGLRVTVPIGGTLANPVVDREAFNLAMRDLGNTLRDRALPPGASELLQRLFPPRDPNAPPPLTPAERRAQRRQRRMQP
jgi:translocation and assembly module TamB